MNEKLTELVFIVDRSGSMAGMESDTIGGVNGYIRSDYVAVGGSFAQSVMHMDDMEMKVHFRTQGIKDQKKTQ